MALTENETRWQLIDRQLEKAGWRLEDLGTLHAGDEVRLKRAGYPFATHYQVEVVRRSV